VQKSAMRIVDTYFPRTLLLEKELRLLCPGSLYNRLCFEFLFRAVLLYVNKDPRKNSVIRPFVAVQYGQNRVNIVKPILIFVQRKH
jgi:hypothetical protein